MADQRIGRQTPTASVVCKYEKTLGQEAIDSYELTGRTAEEWQRLMVYDIMSVNEDHLWTHSVFGYSVSRRNGKGEILAMIEKWDLEHGLKTMHTAHRTTTSADAAARLAALLNESGYTEVIRVKKSVIYDKHYVYAKQLGLEKITLLGPNGGTVSFRTRTSKGGLGEGYDRLIIDEAQEYTDDQESSLKYMVSSSSNPQILMCGTPPTAVSTGTVFKRYRAEVLFKGKPEAGWAEWSVDKISDPNNVELWYECNPSMGTVLTERKVRNEIGSDVMDFNIQRLGYWPDTIQSCTFSAADWKRLACNKLPDLTGGLYIGIKYGADGENVSMALACRAVGGKIWIEALGCRPRRDGNDWICSFLRQARGVEAVVIDGVVGQSQLAADLKDYGVRKKPQLPGVKDVVNAYAALEMAITGDSIRHANQPSLAQAVTNCTKRPIGTNGGFGYKSTIDGIDISLVESCALALWLCQENRQKKRQIASC